MKRRKEAEITGRQQEILRFIQKNPGTHLREMQRRLTISSMGNLEYHIHILVRIRLVVEKEEGGYKRYYPAQGAVRNKKLLACMRQKMPRRIAAVIIEKMLENRCFESDAGNLETEHGEARDGETGNRETDPLRNGLENSENTGIPGNSDNTGTIPMARIESRQDDAVEGNSDSPGFRSDTTERVPDDCGLSPSEIMDALGIPASSLSYHLTKMDKRGIIRKQRSGKHVIYTVEKPEELFSVIVSYRESFADGIVDSFLESWGM